MKPIIDENFSKNRLKYVTQCMIVSSFLFLIMLFFDFVIGFPMVASLGVAFVLPLPLLC